MIPKKLGRVKLEKWVNGLHPDLQWAITTASRLKTSIDFIYDSQGPGVSVNGEKRAVSRSDLKFFECRLRRYDFVEAPSRIFFEFGEILFFFLTERGHRFARFVERWSERPRY